MAFLVAILCLEVFVVVLMNETMAFLTKKITMHRIVLGNTKICLHACIANNGIAARSRNPFKSVNALL